MSEENVTELKQPEKTKIKQKKVNTADFMESFKKLSLTPTLSGELTFKIKREYRKAKSQNEQFDEIRNDLLNQWGKKDAEGNLVQVETGGGRMGTVLLKEHIADFNKKIKEMEDVEIEFAQLKYADLKGNSLNAFDLEQLDFIVE